MKRKTIKAKKKKKEREKRKKNKEKENETGGERKWNEPAHIEDRVQGKVCGRSLSSDIHVK